MPAELEHRVLQATAAIHGHHASAMPFLVKEHVMAPAPFCKNGPLKDLPDVLSGPRSPMWNCKCGQTRNWASRVRCACGKMADRKIIDAAIDAANAKPARPAKNGGSNRGRGDGNDMASLSKQLEKMLDKKLASLRGASEPSGNPSGAAAAAAAGAGDAEDGKDDMLAKIRAEISKFEKLKSDEDPELRAVAEARLPSLRRR